MNEPTSFPVGSPLVFFSPYSFDSHSFIQVHSLELLHYFFRTLSDPLRVPKQNQPTRQPEKKTGRVGGGGDDDDDEHTVSAATNIERERGGGGAEQWGAKGGGWLVGRF